MELIVAGLVVVVLFAVVLFGAVLLALALVVWARRRRTRADPAARAAMLEGLGYVRAGSAWTRPVENGTLVFDDGAERGRGWKWTVRLPRYNTMSLTVAERSAGATGGFPSGIPELDARFVFTSTLAAQTVGLVGNGSVANAMLAVPWLSMKLGADELVVEDPGLRGLGATAGGAEVGTPGALLPEKEIHLAVAVLVSTVFRTLYSRFSGTIMDEFR